MRLLRAHSAAASWDRAELCVQTNTTRGTGPTPGEAMANSASRHQAYVGPPAVTLRPVADDESGVLQHLQVMRDQVGRQAQGAGDLAGRRVAEDQRVDDGQPRGLAQCGMHLGPRFQRDSVRVH